MMERRFFTQQVFPHWPIKVRNPIFPSLNGGWSQQRGSEQDIKQRRTGDHLQGFSGTLNGPLKKTRWKKHTDMFYFLLEYLGTLGRNWEFCPLRSHVKIYIYSTISNPLQERKKELYEMHSPLKPSFPFFYRCHMAIMLKINYKNNIYCHGWCGSVKWVPACKPKGQWFNSQSEHMSGLWARSPVAGTWEATTHWCFPPSLSPSLPFSLKINK